MCPEWVLNTPRLREPQVRAQTRIVRGAGPLRRTDGPVHCLRTLPRGGRFRLIVRAATNGTHDRLVSASPCTDPRVRAPCSTLIAQDQPRSRVGFTVAGRYQTAGLSQTGTTALLLRTSGTVWRRAVTPAAEQSRRYPPPRRSRTSRLSQLPPRAIGRWRLGHGAPDGCSSGHSFRADLRRHRSLGHRHRHRHGRLDALAAIQ